MGKFHCQTLLYNSIYRAGVDDARSAPKIEDLEEEEQAGLDYKRARAASTGGGVNFPLSLKHNCITGSI